MYDLLVNYSFAVYFAIGIFIIITDFIMDFNKNLKNLKSIIPNMDSLAYSALILFSFIIAALIWPHTIYRWVIGKSLLGGEKE